MTDYRPIYISGGKVIQLSTSDGIEAGTQISASSGSDLTLTANAAISIASGINLASAGGAADFDFSGSSGTFKTSTGDVTVGGAATFTSSMAMTGSNIDLDPTGTFALDMDASQTVTITVADDLANSFLLQEGGNAYFSITTTNDSEAINIGNATTNPDLSQLGTGQVTFAGNVDATNGLDVTTAALTAAAGLTVSGDAITMTGSNIDLDPTGTFALDMDAAQTATITVADDLADAFLLQEGANAYIDVTTTTDSEAINLGNASTNPDLSQLGTGQVTFAGNVDATNGLDVTTAALTAAAGLTISGDAITMTGSNIDLDPTGTFALDMDASQTVTITVADNLGDALLVQEGGNAYIDITTTDSSEKVEFGNATSNPDYEFLGSGLVDLANGTAEIPGGTSLTVGAVQCTAGVTGTNLNTLTDGSNADALHTHSGLSSSQVVVAGLTTTGLADGDFGYVSANGTMTKTDATTEAKSYMFGANEGTASSMTVGGVVENAKFTTDGGSPSAGDPVYLALGTADTGTGAGKLTATAPTTAGQYVAEVGICLDNSNYDASKTCEVLLRPKVVVAL